MSTMQSLAAAAMVGLLSGTHAAIWGMYKDSVHEGFSPLRFVRSMVVGALAAAALQSVLRLALPGAGAIALLFGLAYALERTLIEMWKTFLREEDQSKYFIPMQFSIRGVPVTHRGLRALGALVCVSAMWGALLLVARIPSLIGPGLMRGGIVGLVAGLIVAAGGCWKDAPTEGFDIVKFFRSPAMTVFYALALSRITSQPMLIAAAAIGFERGTVETYKKFFFPMKPPGKFAGKPVAHPHMFEIRRYFVPAYVSISAAAAGFLGLAVTQ